MPRLKTILQCEYPYNISARCINRDWFQIPMETVWNIFCEELTFVNKKYHFQIHSFVLMNNHYHLIASTPDSNVSQCMQQFMHRTSKRLTKAGNRINQTFAGRHYKCILQHPNYFLNAYKYNYRNPVAAGVCEKVQEYAYSTLHGKLNLSDQLVPVCEDITLNFDTVGTLAWLNTAPESNKAEGFRYGTKHQYFKSKKDRTSNRPILTEYDLL
jgi:putative transposase